MVKAIQVQEYGGPEVMSYDGRGAAPARPRPDPRPAHGAIGVNFIDIYFRTGAYKAPALPFTPGKEGAGVVDGGRRGRDRIRGRATGSPTRARSAATPRSATIPAQCLCKLPDGINDETAAAMMLKGLTAEYLLRRTYRVKPGDTMPVPCRGRRRRPDRLPVGQASRRAR